MDSDILDGSKTQDGSNLAFPPGFQGSTNGYSGYVWRQCIWRIRSDLSLVLPLLWRKIGHHSSAVIGSGGPSCEKLDPHIARSRELVYANDLLLALTGKSRAQ